MTILDRLLDEVRAAKGPIRASDLARRLDVSESALDGMVSVLVTNGRLSGSEVESGDEMVACSGIACGTSCVGLDDCAFIVSVPQTHHLVIEPVAR